MGKTCVVCIIVCMVLAASIYVCFHFMELEKGKKNHHKATNIAFNATVSKNKAGAGVYITLTEALAAAPAHSDHRYYIHVEAGLYEEQVHVWENLTNIVLIGDEALTTKIQWNRHSSDFPTSETATLTVRGDGFSAMYMVFENNAGDGIGQAVAVMTEANHAAYYRCIFLGYQDTLYAKRGVQFYKNCDIYGTVDIIFGAAAVFQSCNLYAGKSSTNTITFTTQNNKGSNTNTTSGFVIQGCNLIIAPGLEHDMLGVKAYLGRPWSNYSTVVVMESFIDNIVQLAGWLAWENRSTDELTYVEFGNMGDGADTSQRVNWKGYQDLSGQFEKVRRFTVGQFIDQDGWLAAIGIPYFTAFVYDYN